jgi:hypothetical protein
MGEQAEAGQRVRVALEASALLTQEELVEQVGLAALETQRGVQVVQVGTTR